MRIAKTPERLKNRQTALEEDLDPKDAMSFDKDRTFYRQKETYHITQPIDRAGRFLILLLLRSRTRVGDEFEVF